MKNFLLFVFTILIPFVLSGFFILVGLTYINYEDKFNVVALLIGLISTVVFIFTIIRWRKFGKRCKACGKWGTVQKIKNETEKKGTTSIEVKNNKGETRYKRGHEYSLTKYFKCKNCGKEYSRTEDYERVD